MEDKKPGNSGGLNNMLFSLVHIADASLRIRLPTVASSFGHFNCNKIIQFSVTQRERHGISNSGFHNGRLLLLSLDSHGGEFPRGVWDAGGSGWLGDR